MKKDNKDQANYVKWIAIGFTIASIGTAIAVIGLVLYHH